MKDMHFLWKNYMDNLKIPNIVYQSTVKQLLVNKYEFNSDTECFVNIASKHIPKISAIRLMVKLNNKLAIFLIFI